MVVGVVSGLKVNFLPYIEGSMAGVDLGTRVRTNVSKIWKDFNPIEDVDVPLDLSDGRDASGILTTADAEQVSPSLHSFPRVPLATNH